MPRISAFYGVVIYMYWNEKDHPVAHFHAYHAERRASVSADGIVLAGGLEPRALQLVRDLGSPAPPGDSRQLGPGPQKPASAGHPAAVLEWLIMSETYLPVVTGVAVIGEHVLGLLFSDGTVGDVDLSAERWTGVLEPLNDPAFFAQVTVDRESGTVVWPGGIDLAPEPLYDQAHAHPLVAA